MSISFITKKVFLTVSFVLALNGLVFGAHIDIAQYIKDGMCTVDGLDAAYGVDISPDDKFVYVAGGGDDAVSVFSRDTTTGILTFVEFVKNGVNGFTGIIGSEQVHISPDSKHLYVTSDDTNSLGY